VPQHFSGRLLAVGHLGRVANLILRPDWHLPATALTLETAFRSRRAFLRRLGIAGVGTLVGAATLRAAETAPRYPAKRNPQFNPGWRLTNERLAANYNNFYEFSFDKEEVAPLSQKLSLKPWPIEIGGLCEKPMTLEAEELAALFPLEERVYRFRCVEAWSMVVPWTGFPLQRLIEKVVPKSDARFIRMVTLDRPAEMPGFQKMPRYPWPYTEGLRLDEALHPLTLMATGIYGKALPKQHGAPVRLVVPWKYGYKSIKSVVKIEFVRDQPKTFWETLAPDEYPFESNVNPKVPHPRWSQAFERVIDTGERLRTQPFNGYGDQVARLYAKP